MDKLFIGTKNIKARPMNRGTYNMYRNWVCPADENPEDEGYLVEYLDGGMVNHPDHEGYISWSPKTTFEAAYKDGSGFDASMGSAILFMKQGLRVARKGWNGKGMFLYYVPANSYPAQTDAVKTVYPEMVPYGAYIAMKTATGEVVPWLASQTDLLAEDWGVL